MLVSKKVTWEVVSKTETATMVTVQLKPIVPEGITFASPGEGNFFQMPVADCIVNVGDQLEDLTLAQADDGEPEEPVEG